MSDSAKAKRNSHTLFCYILHTEIWANIERVFEVTVQHNVQLVYTHTYPYPMSDSSKPSMVCICGWYRLGKLLGSGSFGKLFCFHLAF
jgi:hypothetical protein